MSPTFFIGIRPPPDLAARVLAWQAELEHVVTAPHVTLLAPAKLPVERWRQAAEQVAARHAPAFVTLSGVDGFGERVIFLRVDAPALRFIHADLGLALGEAVGEFTLENFHPHLTLALSWRSMNVSWQEAVRRAQAAFGDLQTTPLTFKASALVLFGKAEAGQPYTECGRFKLSGAS